MGTTTVRLAETARQALRELAEQSGDSGQAGKLYGQAKTAFTRAVAIDPKSDAGKQADQSLKALREQ